MLKRLPLILACLAGLGFAQVAYQITATTTTNVTGGGVVVVPIPFASIFVCSGNFIGTNPCTSGSAITIYMDAGLTKPWSIPAFADNQGNLLFWVASGGNYFYTLSGTGALAATFQLSLPSNGLSGSDIHFINSLTGGTGNPFAASPFNEFIQTAPTPASPTLAVTGSTGNTWGYEVTTQTGPSSFTLPSSQATGSAAATLNGTNYVTITAVCPATSLFINFYRTKSGGTPSSLGLLGTSACGSNDLATLVDNGQSGTTNPPTVNTTGSMAANTIFLGSGQTLANGSPSFTGGGNIRFPGEAGSIFYSNPSVPASQTGINFAGTELNFGEINSDGTSTSSNVVFQVFGPATASFQYSLGFGSLSGGNVSLWPNLPAEYLSPSGTSYQTLFVSAASSGGSLAQDEPAALEADILVPPGTVNSVSKTTSTGGQFCLGISIGCNQVGLYKEDIFIEDMVSCATQGPAAVSMTVSFFDDRGTHTVPVTFSLNNGTTSTSVPLGLGSNSAWATVQFWSIGGFGHDFNWATTLTGCTTGTATYTIRGAVHREN
ncbi:MAG: hypothetical protein ACREKE_02395 [bacterium]